MKRFVIITVVIFIIFCIQASLLEGEDTHGAVEESRIIPLPQPAIRGEVSLDEAVNRRTSVRRYSRAPVTINEASRILWAAGGLRVDAVSSASRTFPSAGGLYPLEFYLAAGNVSGIEPGTYHYQPEGHSLKRISRGDIRDKLSAAALGQQSILNAPMTLVITADFSRTTGKYGARGNRFVHMDAGHSGGNIVLAVSSLGLGTVGIGAFDDAAVNDVLKLPSGRTALYLFPIGKMN